MTSMRKFHSWTHRLFNEHKFARRFTLFGIFGLIAYATFNIADFSDSKYATLCGLLTVAIGLYQWDKAHERNCNAKSD